MQVFREPIDFSVEASVPKRREFEETIKGRIDSYKHLIYGDDDMAIVNKVLEQVARRKSVKDKEEKPSDGKKRYKLSHFFQKKTSQMFVCLCFFLS